MLQPPPSFSPGPPSVGLFSLSHFFHKDSNLQMTQDDSTPRSLTLLHLLRPFIQQGDVYTRVKVALNPLNCVYIVLQAQTRILVPAPK